MAPVYATPADLAAHLGLAEPPADAEVWLRRASRDVDDLLFTAVYPVDGSGMPTDPVQAGAIKEATCEQAELLIAVDDPTGARYRFSKVKIQQVEYVNAVDPRSGRPVRVRYAGRAVSVLRQVGLLPGIVFGRW